MQAVRVDQVRLTRLQARLHHLSDFKRRRKMPPGAVSSSGNMSSHPTPGKYCLYMHKYGHSDSAVSSCAISDLQSFKKVKKKI
jgi:hypothetical protein